MAKIKDWLVLAVIKKSSRMWYNITGARKYNRTYYMITKLKTCGSLIINDQIDCQTNF